MAQSYNPARNISQNTIKRLYGLSGNVCANPDCREPLVTENNQIGEIAHICAASPDGPRYDPNMSDDERRCIDNLILLCEKCNKLVDSNANDYSVLKLREWKNNHEGFVSSDIYNTYFQNIFAKQKEGVLRKQEIDVDGKIYSSRIIVSHGKTVLKDGKGIHCLADYLLSLAKDYKWDEFPDVFVQGIGGIGKSVEVKKAYNRFLEIFSDQKNYDDYNFFPIVYFFELKNFQKDFYKKFDEKENIILFLDGLDEISGSNIIDFVKYLNNIRSQFTNVRFVISGRQASFDFEINSVSRNKLLIELTDDFDPCEATNRKLIEKFQNSAILNVIPIPFYRKYLEINEDISGYKDFFEKVVLYLLDKDKQKSDYANNIPAREKDKSSINRERIIEELSKLCYKIFCNGRIVFSEQELRESTQDDFLFVINSSLIKYSGLENISFVSNLFFEYFLALYYLSHESKMKKNLFLASGRLNVKYVSIVSIILNIADSRARVVSWLKRKLSKETNAFVLLTDYRTLPPKTRYEYYKRIFEEFSKCGKIIYYLKWRSSFNCLSGVSALNKAMCELIPNEYRNEIFEYLLGYVAKYHNERSGANVVEFTNAIILLGLWGDKLWVKSQQEKLKEISNDVLNTFLYDSLIKERSDGLLNEEVVFYWYKDYGWSKKWSASEWNDFLKQSFPNTQGFGIFANDGEYHFQLELFNEFSDDCYIKRLAKPLCIEIMKQSSEDVSIADSIPNEIDDEFKAPVAHMDSEIYEFISILEEGNFLSADDVVEIIKILIDKCVIFQNTNYVFGELKKRIIEILQSQGNSLSFAKSKELYEIIAVSMDDSKEFPLYEFESCLNVLPDQIKQELLNKIVLNLNGTKWEQNWNFCNLISILLDVNKGVEKNLEFIRQNIQKNTYNFLINRIYWNSNKSKSLYQYVKPLYEKEFAAEIEKQVEKEKLLSEIRKKHVEKQASESSLIINPSAIIEEINAIEEFFKNNSTNGRPDYDFQDLDYSTMEYNIRNEINFKCRHTPIFSDFVVKFLKSFERNSPFTEWFENARSMIKKSFPDDNNFWIGFYDCYIRSHSDEEVKKFLKENENIKKKITDSMDIEVRGYQKKLDIQQILSLNYPIWITPFVKYIQLVFDDKIPEYVDKDKLLMIVAYQTKYLVTRTTIFKNQPPWGNYSSAFDWLREVAGFKNSEIVDKALEIYPQTENLYVKMQLFSSLIEHLDCRERKIADIVLEETRRILEKPEESNAGSDFRYTSLPKFWQNADKKYLVEMIDEIPFEKYGLRHENPCLREVVEFALKHMSIEQKKKLIAKYEDTDDHEMRELMRRLGSKKEILRKISEYLNGGKCDSHFGYNHAYLFGFVRKDLFILIAYCRLFIYSMKKESERRSALFTIAKKGIREHLGPFTFRFLKIYVNWCIAKRRTAGLYVDGLYDFIDEMEQSVYSR